MWNNRKLSSLLIMNQNVSVVSKAVCPASVRHSVALGKAAQQRRLFVMFAARFFYEVSRFCSRHMPAFVPHVALVRFVKVFFLLFLLSDGVFLCMALYKQFLLLNKWFLLALLSVLLAITLACLLFDEIIARCKSTVYKNRHAHRSPVTEYEYMSLKMPAKEWEVPPSQSYVPQHFLDTPLPTFSLPPRSSLGHMEDEPSEQARPLIRVLETIDMSSTNIEHFLDSEPPTSSFHDKVS